MFLTFGISYTICRKKKVPKDFNKFLDRYLLRRS